MVLLICIILSFGPALVYASIVYWLDRYEKEPRLLIGGVFVWGAIVAVFGALVWSSLLEASLSLFVQSASLIEFSGSTFIAPLVEESVKGLGVLIVFLAFRREFDSVLDGIVYAATVALGFAATENVLYLYNLGYGEGGWGSLAVLFFLRVILGGWNHAVYTSFTGIGLATTRLSRNPIVKGLAPLLGWCAAMFAHGLHNGMTDLATSAFGLGGFAATVAVDWIGWGLIFGVILWAIARERRWLTKELREEVDHGVISQAQYLTACSTWAQTGARLHALSNGRYRLTRRFYQLCGELALKKHQQESLGDERGNSAIIERLRGELGRLAAAVAA